MSTAALQNILSGIQAHNLRAANMRWLAEQLLDAADAEDNIRPYTVEELEARIAKSEDDVIANRTYSSDEAQMSKEMFINRVKTAENRATYTMQQGESLDDLLR